LPVQLSFLFPARFACGVRRYFGPVSPA
jgi:hypothetical protein